MNINVKATNRILWIIALLLIVGGGVWAIFLNDAQRIVVGGGVALGLLNLLMLSFFFNKNMGANKRKSRTR